MHIKKVPQGCRRAKLNFLQYTYRIRINHKTLYSQTFPGPQFGSWTKTIWLLPGQGQLTLCTLGNSAVFHCVTLKDNVGKILVSAWYEQNSLSSGNFAKYKKFHPNSKHETARKKSHLMTNRWAFSEFDRQLNPVPTIGVNPAKYSTG